MPKLSEEKYLFKFFKKRGKEHPLSLNFKPLSQLSFRTLFNLENKKVVLNSQKGKYFLNANLENYNNKLLFFI